MGNKKTSFFFTEKYTAPHTSLQGAFLKEDLTVYETSWQQKGSLKAMINWYRAWARYNRNTREIFAQRSPVQVPVWVSWE